MSPPGEGRRALTAFAGVAAVLVLFFSPALVGGGQFLYRDAGRHYHPMKHWLATEWRAGRFPEWNPLSGLGLPEVAVGIDAPQHPLNLLFLALPFEAAFTAWVVACYLLAAGGMLAWARSLGARTPAATVAALAFPLSGFLVSSSDNLIHLASMAAAPWLLWAARRQVERGGARRALAVLAASFLCAAGGEVIDWAVATILAPLLALSPGPEAEAAPARVRAGRAVGTLAAALVGAAPVLLPFLAWLPGSSRGEALDLVEAARWNLHPLRLLELGVPHLARGPFSSIRNEVYRLLTGDTAPTPWTLSLYVGAPVVALAVLAAARGRAARWLVGAAALTAWAAMGHRAGFGALAAQLPVLAGVRYFERLAGWPTLLLGAAAALGAAAMLEGGRPARRTSAGALAAALLLGLTSGAVRLLEAPLAVRLGGGSPAAGALVDNLGEGTLVAAVSLTLLAGVAWLVAAGRLGRAAPLALATVVAVDLFSANVRAYLLSRPALVEPAVAPIPTWLAAQPGAPRVMAPFALDRERWPELSPFESSWRWGARTAAASFHAAWGVRSFDVYAGVVPGRLARFQRRRALAARAVPAGLLGVAGVVVPHALERAGELGLRPPFQVLAADPELPAWVVELPHRPRAYLAGELLPLDARGALDFLAFADPASEGRTALEGVIPAGYRPPRGTARLERDEPERVGVAVESDGPALLVLGDQLDPGWTAEVDGRPAGILAANYLVRGVWVEAGRHTVEFRYRTPWWRAGWLVTLGGALTLLAAWLVGWRRAPERARRTAPVAR